MSEPIEAVVKHTQQVWEAPALFEVEAYYRLQNDGLLLPAHQSNTRTLSCPPSRQAKKRYPGGLSSPRKSDSSAAAAAAAAVTDVLAPAAAAATAAAGSFQTQCSSSYDILPKPDHSTISGCSVPSTQCLHEAIGAPTPTQSLWKRCSSSGLTGGGIHHQQQQASRSALHGGSAGRIRGPQRRTSHAAASNLFAMATTSVLFLILTSIIGLLLWAALCKVTRSALPSSRRGDLSGLDGTGGAFIASDLKPSRWDGQKTAFKPALTARENIGLTGRVIPPSAVPHSVQRGALSAEAATQLAQGLVAAAVIKASLAPWLVLLQGLGDKQAKLGADTPTMPSSDQASGHIAPAGQEALVIDVPNGSSVKSTVSATISSGSKKQSIGPDGGARMTAAEARGVADLFFSHLLPGAGISVLSGGDSPSRHLNSSLGSAQVPIMSALLPPELQLPVAKELVELLRQLWQQALQPYGELASQEATARPDLLLGRSRSHSNKIFLRGQEVSGSSIDAGHQDPKAGPQGAAIRQCATSAGAALLQSVVEAAKKLHGAACGPLAPAAAVSAAGMPFVILRRITVAVLHMLHEEEEGSLPEREACRLAVAKVAPDVLNAFSGAVDCSRTLRPAVELLHISKSGGTSMCQLANDAGLRNPNANIDGNCLLPHFYDEPKWSRLEAGMSAAHVWPAVNCPDWLNQPDITCEDREAMLRKNGINFYANEGHLHEGTAALGSAHACPQFETAVVLREPVERTRSHIIELGRIYSRIAKGSSLSPQDGSRSLMQWKDWTPALVDNYMTRSLLGRHFMHCRDFGTLGEAELLSASLSLASLDHVLILGEDALNDVAMKAGMGWPGGLASKRWRWSYSHDLERELGFPADTMEQLGQWNQIDGLLHVWGINMLRLDVAFHSAVAVIQLQAEAVPCSQAMPPTAASTTTSTSTSSGGNGDGRRGSTSGSRGGSVGSSAFDDSKAATPTPSSSSLTVGRSPATTATQDSTIIVGHRSDAYLHADMFKGDQGWVEAGHLSIDWRALLLGVGSSQQGAVLHAAAAASFAVCRGGTAGGGRMLGRRGLRMLAAAESWLFPHVGGARTAALDVAGADALLQFKLPLYKAVQVPVRSMREPV